MLHLVGREGIHRLLARGERGVTGGLAARVRDGAVHPRVGEAREAIADLLPGARQLRAREAVGRARERPVDGVVQAPGVRARRARGEDDDRPVAPVLDAEAELVAEPHALADLLEEAGVGIGADHLDRHRRGQQGARHKRRRHETHEVHLRRAPVPQPEHARSPRAHVRCGMRDPRPA